MTDSELPIAYESPLHAYAIMLHERLESCEDDMRRLRRDIDVLAANFHRYVTSTYFKVTLEVAVKDPKILWDMKRDALDTIFHRRADFLPKFAYIKWICHDDTFRMDAYVLLKNSVALLAMQAYIPAATVEIFEGAYGELKARVKNDIGYYLTMPPPHNDIGAELWRLGGDGVDFELQEDMTGADADDIPFTRSPNYSNVFALQCVLHEHVRHRNWFELFCLTP